MKVWYFTPYSTNKNLGQSYNEYLSLIPEGDSACIMDGDACFLNSDFGHIIHEYAKLYPNAVLTCYINRIHSLAKGQLHPEMNSADIRECLEYAERIKGVRTVTPVTGSVSGTLLVIPKHIWKRFPFSEVNTFRPGEPNLLGCDNEWTNRIRANGIKVLRMDGLLIYHQYRLLTNSKQHLL